MDLVNVTNVTDEMIIVRCYGTKTKNINAEKLAPVSVDTFRRTLLHIPRNSEQASPFIWEIDLEDIPALVKARNLKLDNNCTMRAVIKVALHSIRPNVELHQV